MARHHPRRTVRVFVALLALSGLVALVPAAPAKAALTPVEFEECLLDLINADRAKVGAPALIMATDKVPAVRDWSEWMRFNEFRHMNSSERNPILPPGTTGWGENIAWHSSPNIGCSTIHSMFMNSSGHRANILHAGYRFAALGTYVDGSGWWVTELFFNANGYSPVCNGTFCDDEESIFEADIEKIAAEGITNGCGGHRRFCPRDRVTRGQMAAFLSRGFELTDRGTIDFIDDDNSIFEPDIERIATAGYTNGCTYNRFCPTDHVTRGQMAAFLARALGL